MFYVLNNESMINFCSVAFHSLYSLSFWA